MGNPASKFSEGVKEEEELSEGSVPSTPILTPKNRILEDLDPRSPSANIVRTPIQLILNGDLNSSNAESEEDNKCDTFNINSPALKVLGIDPRSPTLEIIRTPIIISDDAKLPQKLHNKNLDNVRKTVINMSPKKIADISACIPPKLLESSPITTKSNENKRKSYVGLLETNLDYIETDLDQVIRSKSLGKLPDSVCMSEKSHKEDEIKETEKIVPQEKNVETLNEPENILVEDDGLIAYKNLEEEKSAPKIIEVTPKLSERNSKITEFDKKINNLIYTDDDVVILSPRNVIVNDGKRTPLGIRNGQPRKHTPKLKVSDKPRKSDYAVSKIPVFKEKKQTENIPPKNISGKKNTKLMKSAQWDVLTDIKMKFQHPQKDKMNCDIEGMLKEFNLDYNLQAVNNLRCVAENLTIKLLKDAQYYSEGKQDLNKEDVLLAISMENENQKQCEQLDAEEMIRGAEAYNTKPIELKESFGLKLPKENLGNVNFQLENPKKKMKMEAANKYETYGTKQFGNCFTFLMPQKHYKQPPIANMNAFSNISSMVGMSGMSSMGNINSMTAMNNMASLGNMGNMGGFVIKNNQAIREVPMKITIRPKFNVQQQPHVSMLKKNNK